MTAKSTSTAEPDNRLSLTVTLRQLWPWLWRYRVRMGVAALCLVLAKLTNVAVPLTLKSIVDTLSPPDKLAAVTVPLALLVAYGLLRLSGTVFNELRSALFARVSQRVSRAVARSVFEHIQNLSLRFHLDRRTGGLSRDLERGTRAISSLLSYLIFAILPTAVELIVVTIFLIIAFGPIYAVVTVITIGCYFWFTYVITRWRTKFRVTMNEQESSANSKAVDALLNFETVKYFNNESFEIERYDQGLNRWENAAVKSQTSLAWLNVGQGAIISAGLAVLLIMAAYDVVSGKFTMGDFVMLNAFLLQLYIPLSFLGTIFREVNHSLIDTDRMFGLLNEEQEITQVDDAVTLDSKNPHIRFENVHFAYNANRKILRDISFEIPPGKTVAVVGPSGSGKSTLSRLLFRFYDASDGRITIDGHDIRKLDLDSMRRHIGVVPQDTVLFNDSIGYNIAYGRPDSKPEQIQRAASLANLDDFINQLPEGYDTIVGERGLKVSGGEKQRISIARSILKDPPILILDEATSALDSGAERAVQSAMDRVSDARTTLVISHRLSTIVGADEILVLDRGEIVERGNHQALLDKNGHYAKLWHMQLKEAD